MSKCAFAAGLAATVLIAGTPAKAQYQKDRGPETKIRVCAQNTCTPKHARTAAGHTQAKHPKSSTQ